MQVNSNQSSQLKSQSPRGMPIRQVALTQKRMTDKFQYGQNSPRNNFTNNKRRGTNTIESGTAGASIQQLRHAQIDDEIIEENYYNRQKMPRVSTLAKVKVRPKNQIANDSYANETSANQSTSYGGFPSPRQTSGKRTVSLQQHLTKDSRNRIISSKRRNDSLRMQTSLQKPAIRSMNKGARAMNYAIQNSNILMQHVQVPLQLFASNEGPHIAKKNFKEDDNIAYQSNQNIYVQSQMPNNQNILNSQNLISQDISLNTLPHYEDSRNDSVQQNAHSPELQQHLQTHQTSGTNVQIEGDERNGIQYLMAPPISQMGTQQSLLADQMKNHNAPSGQLQASMSWNMQTSSPVALADLKKKQALQEKLSKHIGSQTFAQKQVHENSGVQFGSNENFQTATIDDERDSYFMNSQLNHQFNATGKSIFDHTPLQEMPSVKPSSKTGTVIPRIDTQQINSYADQPILPPQINPSHGIGFVNYVNGVPVSIQLNKNELMSSSALGKFPKTSINRNNSYVNKMAQSNLRVHVKSDLDKKIQAFNNHLYLQKQITQNLVEVQAKQGQYLPIIDTTGIVQAKPFMPTNVRPDFFRTKRKMQNLTVLRGIYDDGFQGYKQSQILDHDNFPVSNPLRNSMESPENDVFSGLNYKGPTGSFSLKRSLKKRKAFPPKESYSNKKQLKQHLEEFMDGKKKTDKYNTNNVVKSPIIESARSRASSKPPTNIDPKDLPKKLQTAKAGSRQQHYTTAAVTKAIGTSQALKRNHNHSNKKLKNKTQIDDADKNKISNTNADIYGVSLDLNNTSAFRPSDIGANQKSAISKYDGGTRDRKRSPIRVQGQSPVPATPDKYPTVYPFNHSSTFQKVPFDASLFKMKVPRLDMEHLMRDDLDEMSKLEVIYKILKNQLRQHQKTLIKLREEETKRKKRAKEEAEAAGTTGRTHSYERDKDTVDIREFARYIKPFELHGPQRDLSPELRRIVRNLTCQEHSYVYCPRCKKYEETEHDPMANIKKFMKQIKDEQRRLNQEDPFFKPPVKKKEKKKKEKPLPDDSVSDITDLEEDEILAKYFKKKASKVRKEKKEQAKQRASARQRLLGEQVTNRHSCKDHRVLTEEEKQRMALDDTVVLELRKPEKPVHMHDEDQSAHQFSVREQSIQADSEERLDIEMQASKVEDFHQRRASVAETPAKGSPGRIGLRDSFEMPSASRQDRSNTEKKGRLAGQTQFSASPVRSINLSPVKNSPLKADGKLLEQFTLFKPQSQKSEMAIQTEPGHYESKRGIKFLETDQNSLEEIDEYDKHKHLDNYKEDWADSTVYKKAMKNEAIKRGLPYDEYDVVDDDEAYELQTHLEHTESGELVPDHSKSSHEIGFLKKFNEKGNIQMLKESEVGYLKTLLKKDAEKWEYVQNLADIYRHCKFTIRMLTRTMARIDNKHIFRKSKQTDKQNTLTMIYRAEVLYSAKGDANKIFQNMSKYIFDYGEFERIQLQEQVEDPQEYKFIKQREILLRRLLSQITNFLSQYKIFDDSFIFKQINIYDYLRSELEKVSTLRQYIDGQNNESFLGISHKLNENKKKIVNPKKAKKVTPFTAQKSPRIEIDGESDNKSGKSERGNDQNTEALKSARSKKSKTDREANKSSSKVDQSQKPMTTMSQDVNKTTD